MVLTVPPDAIICNKEPPLRLRRPEHGAEFAPLLFLHRRREPRQKVLLVAAASVADAARPLLRLHDRRDVLVDDADGLAEPPLASDASELHRLPHDGGRVEHAREGDLDGGVKRLEERVVPAGSSPAPAAGLLELEQRRALDSERDAADVVEGEALEHVLQVNGLAGVSRTREERKEPAVQVAPEDAPRKAAQRAGREGVGRELALEAAQAAVREEDAAAEEVAEGPREARALDVVGEPRPQHVVDDARVRRGDAAAEAERAAHLYGGGRGGRELVGGGWPSRGSGAGCGPGAPRCRARGSGRGSGCGGPRAAGGPGREGRRLRGAARQRRPWRDHVAVLSRLLGVWDYRSRLQSYI